MRGPTVVMGMAVVWCAASSVAGGISLVSVAQEVEIGQEANAQVRRKVPELNDRQVSTYVRGLGRRLAQVAPGPRYAYTVSVADYRDINAFALPGGPVWIHRGVLQAATNESQVVGVLAHEIAHIGQRHAAAQLTNAMVARWGIGLLGAMLGSSGGAGAAQIAAGLLTNGVFLKFSRDDEREADAVGAQIMTRAGWDSRGMVQLFEIMQRTGRREPRQVDTFLSTHPSTEDRIQALRTVTGRRAGGRRDSQQFRSIKARLQHLPPAHPVPTS